MTSRAAASRSTPVGSPSSLAADHAAGRVRAVAIDAGRRQRRTADQQRVVVVRPQRAAPAGRHGLEVVGRRPAAPPIGVPAVALQPGLRVGEREVGGADEGEPLGQRRGAGQVDLAGGRGGAGEVQVRVGQPGDRHLVRLEHDPLRERVGARLERDLGAGERDPAVADPDRLDPAEALLAGERGDPAGDQHLERHGSALAGRRAAPRGRRDRARRRSRAPARRAP